MHEDRSDRKLPQLNGRDTFNHYKSFLHASLLSFTNGSILSIELTQQNAEMLQTPCSSEGQVTLVAGRRL
jgi:hypothetical protein